jgi:hypothetical protein
MRRIHQSLRVACSALLPLLVACQPASESDGVSSASALEEASPTSDHAEYLGTTPRQLDESRGDCWVRVGLEEVKLSQPSVAAVVNSSLARRYEDYLPASCNEYSLVRGSIQVIGKPNREDRVINVDESVKVTIGDKTVDRWSLWNFDLEDGRLLTLGDVLDADGLRIVDQQCRADTLNTNASCDAALSPTDGERTMFRVERTGLMIRVLNHTMGVDWSNLAGHIANASVRKTAKQFK